MERNSYSPSLKHLCFWILPWLLRLFSLLLPPAAAGIYITELCSEERWISTSIKSCFHSEIYYHPQHAAAWMQRIWKKMSHGAAESTCGVEMELLGKERMGITHQTWLLEGKTRERWEEVSMSALVAGLGSSGATGRALRRGSWGGRESGMSGRGSGVTAQQHSPATARLREVPCECLGVRNAGCTCPWCRHLHSCALSTHRAHLGHSQHPPLLLMQESIWATVCSNTQHGQALTQGCGLSTKQGAARLPAGMLQEGHKQGMDKLTLGAFSIPGFSGLYCRNPHGL